MKTFSAKPETVRRDWYVVDATDKTLGRLATELGIGRAGERRGALVTDAVVVHPPLGLLDPEGVGDPEIRVADHPEDVADAPVGEGFHHHVADRPNVLGFDRHPDVNPVVALLDREGLDPVVVPRRLSGDRIVVPAVPRAAQQPVLDAALAERDEALLDAGADVLTLGDQPGVMMGVCSGMVMGRPSLAESRPLIMAARRSTMRFIFALSLISRAARLMNFCSSSS